MSRNAITVEGLGKRYRIGLRETRSDTIAGAFTTWVRAPLTNYRRLRGLTRFDGDTGTDVIWALRDVTFDVARGALVGILGRNGAGKSTLLKILSRITDPTTGRAVLRGRVSSLLEVGTGFHPELTGRENIYLNGTILGMTKGEVDRKFDEIVAFSGVERFVDTPVKRYSSGMQVRLAFSVAAHLEPEILLVDEVLSVGDAEFQRKCIGKMGEVAGEGRTVLFVSHNLGSLQRLCTEAICFSDGSIVDQGETSAVVRRYLDRSVSHDPRVRIPPAAHRFRGGVQVRIVELGTGAGRNKTSFLYGEDIVLRLGVEVRELVDDVQVGIGVQAEGTRIATVHGPAVVCEPSRDLRYWVCTIPGGALLPGFYDIHVGARRRISRQTLDWVPDAISLQISPLPDAAVDDRPDKGSIGLPARWAMESRSPAPMPDR